MSNFCQIFNKNVIQQLTQYNSGRMIYFRENSNGPYTNIPLRIESISGFGGGGGAGMPHPSNVFIFM